MSRLEGKTAVITGGASGIGAAATERFRAEGATVLVADLKSGPTADEFVRCDVTNSTDVDELAEPGRDRRRGAVPGQRDSSYVTGATLPADGGYTAV